MPTDPSDTGPLPRNGVRSDGARMARRPRKVADRWLRRYVGRRLGQGWSPQQIAARLRRDYLRDMHKRISHETIYAAIYIIPRGELRRTLIGCLRQHRKVRRKRHRSGERRGQIQNDADRRAAGGSRGAAGPGPLGGRLAQGSGQWLRRRQLGRAHHPSGRARPDPGTRLAQASQGFARKLQGIPQPLRKSMTYDQGREMARQERLSKKLCLRVYFADPHSPWQRGTNENTNGLLRQYLPKNADLDALSQRELNAIAARLNNRPRQTLNWMTPNEAWDAQLKSLNVCTWNLRPPPLIIPQ